ncbi:EnpEP protein [Paenibacillus swuensis]|uniref:EnpEP protein n=1 Tax=Paenibacillus swuensis TaxID=1178515 RepID=A0A172TG39_9BACL|nr:M1 family metallopeptidase [Paenibacillus swuensis]ANE45922.1 EnpEP protein [Paenibacillus swuensis]
MNHRLTLLLLPLLIIIALIGIVLYDPAEPSRSALSEVKPSGKGANANKSKQQPKAKPQPPSAKAPSKGTSAPDLPVVKKPEPLSKRVVEYHIHAKWNPANKQINGTQTLTWTNPGKNAVSEMYFHLYPNAFESMDTTFMKESGGKLRSDQMQAGSFGFMNITAMKTAEGTNLLPRLQPVQPDDGNKNDRTLVKLRLPEPVPPKGSITLRMAFEVQLPHTFARMGYAGDFVMAGQWFPKAAAYELAGTRGRSAEGWNAHQYHGNSEFYSDFGIYNVKVAVPSNYVVAATGFQTKPTADKNGIRTYQFYADDVHDFAWSASPHFVYAEEPFSAPNVPGVRIKLYLDPKHKDLQDRYFHAAKSALTEYSKWYGQYPYSTLSIVVPPEEGNGAGGMEYPTLVTGFGASTEDPGLELERVVVHEIAHQYWYGIVASNEFEEAWLDEGFASYSEDKVMEKEYGVAPNLPVESSYITSPAPLKQLSWKYNSHNHYAENVYTRAKLVLLGIEKEIGQKAMSRVIRTYFAKWKYKHPSTSDFQAVLEQITKKDWDRYFNQYVYGNMMADYAVEDIRTERVRQNGNTVYEHRVYIRKHGADFSKIPIVFQFEDGTSMKKMWNGTEALTEYKITNASPLAWVAIDPQYTIVVENKHINNFMKADVATDSNIRWNLSITKIVEALIGSLAW